MKECNGQDVGSLRDIWISKWLDESIGMHVGSKTLDKILVYRILWKKVGHKICLCIWIYDAWKEYDLAYLRMCK